MAEFENDVELFNQAMNNAYLLVTNRTSFDNLMDALDRGVGNVALPFNPKGDDGKSDMILDMLLEHFISTEEYEKCSELMKIKNSIGEEI
tara:strand:- start:2027 stop:2296 length:270 start_codon:yes stop_codon:yes gene_type:complete